MLPFHDLYLGLPNEKRTSYFFTVRLPLMRIYFSVLELLIRPCIKYTTHKGMVRIKTTEFIDNLLFVSRKKDRARLKSWSTLEARENSLTVLLYIRCTCLIRTTTLARKSASVVSPFQRALAPRFAVWWSGEPQPRWGRGRKEREGKCGSHEYFFPRTSQNLLPIGSFSSSVCITAWEQLHRERVFRFLQAFDQFNHQWIYSWSEVNNWVI